MNATMMPTMLLFEFAFLSDIACLKCAIDELNFKVCQRHCKYHISVSL